jgi:alkanesulfonate monooxygenase SsuD/methylene tetrahydromethanopterin reductase-like flavin-dependent oxidoreductase (luciferase family)
MQVGFFFWPYTLDLCESLAERADRYGYAMIGIADTPGNAMDPWVSATIVARASRRARVALCVTNLLTRHPAASAAAIASLDHVSNGRAVLGIGAGHSGTRNVGLAKSNAKELAQGVAFIKTLLHGKPANLGAAGAHLPWVKRAAPVFWRPPIRSRCGRQARPPTASSRISDWAPTTLRRLKRTSSRARSAPAACRRRSRFGKSRPSIATRTATWRAARSGPCWLFSPGM